MRVTDFSVERPVSITMLVAIVMVVGAIALSRLGVDMLPDINYPTLSVMVRYPGAPSEEVEAIVARNYEGALASISGVEKIRSVSQEDVAFLMVDFVWGTDLDAAAADIREAVAMIEPYMPPDVESPVVIKFNLSSFPQAMYLVSGLEDNIALRELLTETVQPRLERLEGVAQAPVLGGRVEEIQVDVDRSALQGTGVSLDQVSMALMAQNLNLPAGRQVAGRQELLLRTMGTFDDLDDIRQATVGVSRSTGTPIELGAIATVQRGTKDLRSYVHTDGKEGLMLMFMRESGANPLQVRQRYLDELERLSQVLPAAVDFGMIFDMGMVIELMGRAVFESGLIGALLAIVVMYLFLRAVRPTLIIAAVIPLSLLATFIPIYATGDTLNMMTMGGLVLGIGMLVDNAVVVIENIFRHLEEGRSRAEAAKRGAREVGMAIVASTATTMVVFLPILFSQGLAGQLARGLAITVAAALLGSLFVALTIVPMLASVFFSAHESGGVLDEGSRFGRFRARYTTVLWWCVRHRKATLGMVGGLLVASLGLVPFIGAEFMPASDDPVLAAKVTLPVGTDIAQTGEVVGRIEEVLRRFPDVTTVGAAIGADENDAGAGLSSSSASGPHEAILFARLQPKAQRQIPHNEDLKAAVRQSLPVWEDVRVEFMDMGGMSQGTKPVEIRLYGADFEVLEPWSERIAERLRAVPGLVSVDTSISKAKPERHVIIDRDKAARYGLMVGQVATELKNATLGTIATRMRQAGEETDVRVRYAAPWRDTEAALAQVLIPLPTGGAVPLGQLARIDPGEGPVRIERQDQSRVVTIDADIEGIDLGEAMSRVSAALAPVQQALPPGYQVEYGGQYEDMVDAFGQLALALILAVVMVYMVMASQFESFTHPFTIMFTMPLAVIGVIWIFFLTGTTLSVASFMGVVMLAGVVVNNGIVLVDYINQLRQEGRPLDEAVVTGASTRLRPVLITSLTTIIGMVPMAIGTGEGSETMAPLALTMIGGLTAATGFTLVVVPVVYILVDGVAARSRAFWLRLLHREEVVGG
ncbi:efflux RND transporter permease subunit [Myxococcota bacterium]|nr:efflux RND transporter permease subunit [Myxococcota bacterium]